MTRSSARRGFSLQEMMVVIGIIAIIAAISIPSLVASRQRGNESAGVAGLKAIHTGEARHREVHDVYTDLGGLAAKELVDAALATGKRDGFFFRVVVGPNAANQWAAFAWPQAWGVSADRMFLIERTGRVVMTTEQLVTDEASATSFASSHAFFTTYDLQSLVGWSYLDGGKIGSDSGGGGGGGGGAGGGGDPGCSLRPPGR